MSEVKIYTQHEIKEMYEVYFTVEPTSFVSKADYDKVAEIEHDFQSLRLKLEKANDEIHALKNVKASKEIYCSYLEKDLRHERSRNELLEARIKELGQKPLTPSAI